MAEIFHVFGLDVRLLIVQSINFGIVLLVLWYFLYRPIARMVDARQEKIQKGVEDAESAAKHLEEVASERVSIITSATKEAEGIVAHATVHGKEREVEIVREAEAKSERIVSEAVAKAEEAKKRALDESRGEIAKLAILGAEKVLREKAS